MRSFESVQLAWFGNFFFCIECSMPQESQGVVDHFSMDFLTFPAIPCALLTRLSFLFQYPKRCKLGGSPATVLSHVLLRQEFSPASPFSHYCFVVTLTSFTSHPEVSRLPLPQHVLCSPIKFFIDLPGVYSLGSLFSNKTVVL